MRFIYATVNLYVYRFYLYYDLNPAQNIRRAFDASIDYAMLESLETIHYKSHAAATLLQTTYQSIVKICSILVCTYTRMPVAKA